jgi:hypothetical protein
MRQMKLANTQKNYKCVVYTRACTSRRITLVYLENHVRKSSSLTRVLNTFFWCMTLSVIEWCEENLVSTLLSIASPPLNWSFCLWWTPGNHLVSSEWLLLPGNPVDNLSDVVKTITKEGSFHSILMDSADDPTFFKKTSIPCDIHTKHYTQLEDTVAG